MSIAIVAPEKFDFQDLVCIELMLRFRKQANTQFRVEPQDGEDAELILSDARNTRRIEVQVKGSEAPISLKLLVEFLAHFPDRGDNTTLFERLVADSQRLVLIVASGRCDDSASTFLGAAQWQGGQHDLQRVTRATASTFLGVLGTCLDNARNPSDLTQRRQRHLQGILTRSRVNDAQEALRRLVVIENAGESRLMADCENHLRQDRVPNDAIPSLISRMRGIVKDGKRSQEDILPLILREIEAVSPTSLKPTGYVDRGDEHELIARLRDTGVLLVSGSPRIGKTETARAIAADFETQGYDVREFYDPDAAQRFLFDSAGAQRMALLDDPLGGTHPVPNPSQVLHKLRQFVPRLGLHRKLIVAQAKDRLLEVARSQELAQVSIGTACWEDLDRVPPQFLPALWRRLGTQYGITEPLFTTVLEALVQGSLILETGCLVHLAVDQTRVQNARDLERIARLAREEAADLGRALAGVVSTPLLAALAVGTAPGQPIAMAELAYLTGKGGDRLPGKAKVKGVVTEYAAGAREEHALPSYEEVPLLTPQEHEAIEALELRRIIECSEQRQVTLSHPFFRAAAETLVDGATRGSEDKLLTMLQRGLFCLSPHTSRAAARNIEWIYERLLSKHGKATVIKRAVSGLKSIYPSTRDICFQFLMRHFSDLPASLHDRLPRWIDDVTVSLSDVDWQDGEAVLPLPDETGLLHVGIDFSDWFGDHNERDFLIFDGTADTSVTPEAAWAAAKAYAHHPDRLTPYAVLRLLSYDEALIRARSASAWLALPREDDADVLERIFGEDHPAMAAAALTGAVEGWPAYSESRQNQVIGGLKRMAASPVGAAILIHKLVVFGRGDRSTQVAPWAIFAELLPLVLKVIPHAIRFSDARLYDVVRTASKHIPSSAVLAICDTWIEMVERIATERIPSDYELGVTHILAKATSIDTFQRDQRVARLLALPGTGARIRVVADLVTDWESLNETERNLLIDQIRMPAIDARWLIATVLTRTEVPDALAQLLLPDHTSLQDGAEALSASIPKDVFEAAVCIYVGEPDPLGYVGIDHAGRDVWEPIVERIALDPTHELFELAWNHIVFMGSDERVTPFVARLAAQDPQLAFETLLRIKLRTNGEFMPQAWATLLQAAPDQTTRAAWIKRMASHAPHVMDGLRDATLWLSGSDLDALLPHLASDVFPLEVLYGVGKIRNAADSAELKGSTLKLFRSLFKNRPPVLHETCDQIRRKLDELGWDEPDLFTAIESRRREIIEQPRYRDPAEGKRKIKAWVDVRIADT